MNPEHLVSLTLTRHFSASPERVFDAWLNPETARGWLFTTPASQSHSTEIDARVGGAWRIADRREGVDFVALGEYLEIDRPGLLVFTFGMPQFSPEFCRVTVEIESDGAGCRLTLTQKPVPADARPGLEEGWSTMFDKLAEVVR
ncbi:MAG TPA: SRPBCC domain-containing protein [Caulobacteraceae bacterium]|nr:SRPBCC domain-containing protein [Caulobacteraceae bacterium]